MSYYDYRILEADAERLQKRASTLSAKQSLTQDERDELMSLSGQVHALEASASKVKAAELVELKASIARGTAVSIGEGSYGDSGELRDFMDYMRSGDPTAIRASMSVGSDPGGGFLVPEATHASLIEARRLIDPILSRATHFDMTGDTTMMLPLKATHGVAESATELAARAELTAPGLTSSSLIAVDYWSDQRGSMQLVDSVVGFNELMLRWLGEDILEAYGADIAVGDGSNKPVGLFNAVAAVYPTVFSGSASSLLNTTPHKCYFTLPSRYRPAAVWLCNSATLSVLCGFSSPTNADQPLVDQSGDTFKMLGKPILECESAPDLGAGNYSLAIADIAQAYVTGTHRRFGVLVDDLTAPPKRRWYALARLAGCPWQPEAAVLCRCATV